LFFSFPLLVGFSRPFASVDCTIAQSILGTVKPYGLVWSCKLFTIQPVHKWNKRIFSIIFNRFMIQPFSTCVISPWLCNPVVYYIPNLLSQLLVNASVDQLSQWQFLHFRDVFWGDVATQNGQEGKAKVPWPWH